MSRGITLNHTTAPITEDCYSCGVLFAMPADLRNRRLEDKKQFWCPNGHSMSYVGKTEAEKLQEEVDKLKRQVAYRDDTAKWLNGELEAVKKQRTVLKGQLTKTKNKIAKGKCPVDDCGRTYSNVAEHMRLRHPDYVVEEVSA